MQYRRLSHVCLPGKVALLAWQATELRERKHAESSAPARPHRCHFFDYATLRLFLSSFLFFMFFTTSRLGLWELGHLLFHSQLGRRAGPLHYLAYSPKNFYVKW